MKDLMSVAVVVAMIGMVAAVLTVSGDDASHSSSHLSVPVLRTAFEQALAGVERELAALRLGVDAARLSSAAGVVPRGSQLRELEAAARDRPASPTREEDPALAPPPAAERIGELRGWNEDSRVRQQWMFVGDRQALTFVGTPNRVSVDRGLEFWWYDVTECDEEGEEVTRAVGLGFHRGRLIQLEE